MALLEWTDPPFAPGHWLPDMVDAAGAIDTIGRSGQRSRPIAWAEIASSEPEIIVVAPCGFNLTGATELAERLCSDRHLPREVSVWAVDADAAFVRPGPRLVDGVEALAAIAHPESRPIENHAVARVN
jgi:iron complex transport system substrate-binding protein